MRVPFRQLLVVGGGAVVLATAGFAYMASNTVPASYAGEGSAAVSGYTVSNIDYAGVSVPGGGQVGTMTYLDGPVVNGISEQDGVTTVSFQLSPDNAVWAAVQLYNGGGGVIGGGGASSCTEAGGTWTCNVYSTEGFTGNSYTTGAPVKPIPASEIAYIDVEAAQ